MCAVQLSDAGFLSVSAAQAGKRWTILRFGDCHIHIALDGIFYKTALARHRDAVDETVIRTAFSQYREDGISFLRDGGDSLGVSTRARELAPTFGIDYRTPLFPIHKRGHYGAFLSRGFETMTEYCTLVKEVQVHGDFIKLMISGIMDFNHFGSITGGILSSDEIREMISIAHDHGLAVMAHANGVAAVSAALAAGAESIEHGGYLNDECLHQLAESSAVWVPTLSAIGNLRGSGRYDEDTVAALLASQLQMVASAQRLGACIALGSDAGAWRVPHVKGAADEYALLTQALGNDTDRTLAHGELQIKTIFQRT